VRHKDCGFRNDFETRSNFLLPALKSAPSTPIALIMGIFYASLLFTLAQMVILPLARTAQLEIPLIHIAIAHYIYGFVLSFLIYNTRFKQ
jgi:hypothetical protein